MDSQASEEQIPMKSPEKIHRTTAWRRIARGQVPRAIYRSDANALLKYRQEQDLIAWINKSTDRGTFLTV